MAVIQIWEPIFAHILERGEESAMIENLISKSRRHLLTCSTRALSALSLWGGGQEESPGWTTKNDKKLSRYSSSPSNTVPYRGHTLKWYRLEDASGMCDFTPSYCGSVVVCMV